MVGCPSVMEAVSLCLLCCRGYLMMGKDPGSWTEPGSIDACFGIFNYFGTLFCSVGGAFLCVFNWIKFDAFFEIF